MNLFGVSLKKANSIPVECPWFDGTQTEDYKTLESIQCLYVNYQKFYHEAVKRFQRPGRMWLLWKEQHARKAAPLPWLSRAALSLPARAPWELGKAVLLVLSWCTKVLQGGFCFVLFFSPKYMQYIRPWICSNQDKIFYFFILKSRTPIRTWKCNFSLHFHSLLELILQTKF